MNEALEENVEEIYDFFIASFPFRTSTPLLEATILFKTQTLPEELKFHFPFSHTKDKTVP